MPIKITCPHCKRGMLVEERLAGKKGRCKACQQILTVPSLPTANSSASQAVQPEAHQLANPDPLAAPSDVEEQAAALFSDEPKSVEPVEEKTIDLNCPFCDEAIHFTVDLAGKRAPCPECKRILKVPELVKKDPKDWRKVEARGPSGARPTDQPAPEGAWGSATAGSVAKKTLEEVGVIPKVKPPRTLWQRVRWPVLGVSAALLLGVVGLVGYRWLSSRAVESMLQDALVYAASTDAKPDVKAALSIGAGEYYLRTRKPDSADLANKQLGQTFNTLRSASPGHERDALLADLALAQIDLGGDKADVDNGLRMPWDKVQPMLRATLQEISDPEARLQALRKVVQRLSDRGQTARIMPLILQLYSSSDAKKSGDKAAALAVVGLEFFKAGDRQAAKKAADAALQVYPKDAKDKDAKDKAPPPLRAEVLVLGELLDEKNLPAAGEDDDDKANEYIGKVETLARQGKWPEARKKLKAGEFSEEIRFRARLAVAAAAVDAKLPETDDVESALKMAEGGLSAKAELAWSMLRLTELSLRAGLPEERVQTLADKIGNAALRGRAQLAVFRARLDKSNQAVEDSAADKIDAKSLARSLAAQALARHNARLNGNYAAVVLSWPQPLNSFGALGVVQGLQDREK
ncbi:MAG: zinc ribbon domain-containing protein [Gemmataceae bacterium]